MAKKPLWDVLQGTRPLLVVPYRIITRDPDLAPEQLRDLPQMPSFYMEDFHLEVGDYPLVGHLPLVEEEMDHPIRYGRAVPWTEKPKVIFQCGEIFRELEGAEPPPYCDRFRRWGVRGDIFRTPDLLEKSVSLNSNEPYCKEHLDDLRSRAYRPELETICRQMGISIEQLPAKCKHVFYLAKIERMPYADICDMLSISLATVNYHVSYALAALRKRLKAKA